MIHFVAMKVDVRKIGEIPVLAPEGRVTIGESALALKSALEGVLDSRPEHVIVDGSLVPYMDSTGLGELIAAARTLAERGGRLGVCSPTPKLREILEVTGLGSVFAVGGDAETLVASLAPTRR